ncbi:MAG: hypothetical protein JWN03_5416 [Nocardia sp.]|uniref:hypothetical protein n=1 Tax=Nocardia sp. TaxID=1821 RepID=UPI0026329195|nr:hypothetical protein [Nocardia sp.]MCU1645141.1 hypothetical protein [Nocardia sp.]
MVSWHEELTRREGEATEEVERLRSQIAELTAQLAVVEQRLARLVITRETMSAILSETGVEDAEPEPDGQPDENDDSTEYIVPQTVSPIGAVLVPPRLEGMDIGVLPRDYEEIMAVLAEAEHGMRAGQVATELGVATTERSQVEGLRSKLKRLVARGWAEQAASGVFMIANNGARQGD